MVFMPTAISRKLLLRLDDGSIVGPSLRFRSSANGQEFVRLSAPEALNLGRLTQLHLTFAQQLVQELHSKVPDAEPLPSLSGGSGALKRKTPDTLEANPPPRKQSAPGRERRATSRISTDAPTQSARSASPPIDFIDKCLDINRRVMKALGKSIVWFDHPVEIDKAPDYYSIIHNPMDLGTIQDRLETRQYTSPQQFFEDMKLVWENCHLYNGPHQELGKLGEKTFATFQRLWKHSGLENTSSLRHRRSNAGVAAAKYEPDPAEARPKPSGGQPARSTKSRKEGPGGEMSREHKEWLASVLSRWSETDSPHLDELEEVLQNTHGEDGSVELDFDEMEPAQLWRIDGFVSKYEGPYTPNATALQSYDQESESEDDLENIE